MDSFIHSVQRNILSVYYASGPILGAGVTTVSVLIVFILDREDITIKNISIENLVVHVRKNLKQYEKVCIWEESHVIPS